MKNSRVIQLVGKSRKSNIYIKGVENITSNLNNESIVITEIDFNSNAESANPEGGQMSESTAIPTAVPILVTLYSVASSKSIGEYSISEKIITIGCTKSNKTSDKNTKKVCFFIIFI